MASVTTTYLRAVVMAVVFAVVAVGLSGCLSSAPGVPAAERERLAADLDTTERTLTERRAELQRVRDQYWSVPPERYGTPESDELVVRLRGLERELQASIEALRAKRDEIESRLAEIPEDAEGWRKLLAGAGVTAQVAAPYTGPFAPLVSLLGNNLEEVAIAGLGGGVYARERRKRKQADEAAAAERERAERERAEREALQARAQRSVRAFNRAQGRLSDVRLDDPAALDEIGRIDDDAAAFFEEAGAAAAGRKAGTR